MTELIDYAAPMMRIERLLKDLHNLLLDNKFEMYKLQPAEFLIQLLMLEE